MKKLIPAQEPNEIGSAREKWASSLLICVVLMIIAGMYAVAYNLTQIEHRDSAHELQAEAVSLALRFEQQTNQTIRDLDQFLVFIRNRYESGNIDLVVEAKANFAIEQRLAFITIADDAGLVRYTTIPSQTTEPVNIKHRESFQYHKDHTEDKLHFNKSAIGIMSKTLVFIVSRPVRTYNGKFGGVAIISIPIDSLTQIFAQTKLGVGGGVALIGDDGIFRAGTGSFADRIGDHFRQPTVSERIGAKTLLPNGPEAVIERQIFGNTPRIVATLPVTGMPLRVFVAMTDDFMSKFTSSSEVLYFGTAAFCSILLLAALALIRRWQRLAMSSEAKREELETEKKIAESAALDRSMFLAVMSHEIRTPINGILGALELMRKEELDYRSQRCLNMAQENGDVLLALIDDVLLLSKSEHDKLDTLNAPIVLENFFANVHKSLFSLSLVNRNKFELSLPPQAAWNVMCDQLRLRQILVNLIGNANKFTKRGRIKLQVAPVSSSDKDITLRISVSDTGIGIPKQKHALIFDRFRTLDASYSRRTDGTGLGLAICDKLVRAMGGIISVESEPGKGSCFSFVLTFTRAPASASAPSIPQDAVAAQAKPKALRILLAEDNQTNAYVATEMLHDAGHTVVHAINGADATARAQTEQFDVILMDISMPEVDGIEATSRIRSSNCINASTPIIALTAHAIQGDEQKFLAAGMNGYMTKPLRKDFVNDIRSRLENRDFVKPVAVISADDTPTATVIDVAVLLDFINQRPIDRACKTLDIFVSELDEKSLKIRGLISTMDIEGLKFLAHSNVGSSALVGAHQMLKLSRNLEQQCKHGGDDLWLNAQQLADTIDNTIQEFRRVSNIPAVEKLIKAKRLAA